MDIVGLLDNKTLKSLEKRTKIIESIRMETITIHEIQSLKAVLDDKKMAVILEAIEAISLKNPGIAACMSRKQIMGLRISILTV